MTVAINEIAKKPKLLSDIEDIIYIKDKRKNILKSVVIPAQYLELISNNIEEIKYKIWEKRNLKGLQESLDLDDVSADIGDKL